MNVGESLQAEAPRKPSAGTKLLRESPVRFAHNGFEHNVDRMAQAIIDDHPGSTLTAAYRAVAEELFNASADSIWEEAAQIADKWAQSGSCGVHDENPCCHVRTGAAIAEAIRLREVRHHPEPAPLSTRLTENRGPVLCADCGLTPEDCDCGMSTHDND